MAAASPPGLRGWLLTTALIPEARVDEVLATLHREWVTDVHSLVKVLPALERALPAAAFVAIREAVASSSPLVAPLPRSDDTGVDDGHSHSMSTATHHPGDFVRTRLREERLDQRRRDFKMAVQANRRLLKRTACRCAFHPQSMGVRVWNIVFVGPALAWVALVTPIDVGFCALSLDGLWYANRVVDAILLSDVICRFFVAYEDVAAPASEARIVYSLRSIAWRYASSWLAVDLLAVPPYELFALVLSSSPLDVEAALGTSANSVSTQLARLAGFARLIKLVRLIRIASVLKRWEAPVAQLPYAVVHSAVLFAALVLSAHWAACAWGFVGRVSMLPTEPLSDPSVNVSDVSSVLDSPASVAAVSGGWIDRSGYGFDAPVVEVYARALHLSVSLLFGGSHDAMAVTDMERWVLSAIQITFGLLWCCAVASCVAVSPELWNEQPVSLLETRHLDESLRRHNLPVALQHRVRGYFASSLALSHAAGHDTMLGRLSARLRGDVAHAAARPLLSKVTYFRHGVEADFLANVALSMERALHAPDATLDVGSLTLIERGCVARRGRLFTPENGCLGDDMIVRLAAFRDTTPAVTLSYVQVAVLPRQRLDAILATGGYQRAQWAVRKAAAWCALRRVVLLVTRYIRTASPSPSSTMAREVQLHLLREAVAEEGASDGRGAALSTDGAMAAPSGIKQLVDASSARLEASIDELALRIARNGAGAASGPLTAVRRLGTGGTLLGRAPGKGSMPSRKTRAKRNVCMSVKPSPAAPTIAIKPGEGLPPDHVMAALSEEQEVQHRYDQYDA